MMLNPNVGKMLQFENYSLENNLKCKRTKLMFRVLQKIECWPSGKNTLPLRPLKSEPPIVDVVVVVIVVVVVDSS